jgi:galactonate dehydratase
MVDHCKALADAGWKFVRWHQPPTHGQLNEVDGKGTLEPRESIKLAVEQMGAVRAALPDTEICFDLHTRVDTTHAIQMCRDLEEFKPFFIEDPIRSENASSYKKISEKINLPIAAGEQWGSKWGFQQVIENEWIDYARIDLCIVGGLTEALKITHWAETHYIDIVPHNPLGPVSAAACVQLCMASTNVGVQEIPRQPGTYATDLFPQQIQWDDGYAWAPDVPGLGVDFDEAVAESNRMSGTGWTPQLRRNDGAFTNW